MFCTKCGKQNNGEFEYCVYCGARLSAEHFSSDQTSCRMNITEVIDDREEDRAVYGDGADGSDRQYNRHSGRSQDPDYGRVTRSAQDLSYSESDLSRRRQTDPAPSPNSGGRKYPNLKLIILLLIIAAAVCAVAGILLTKKAGSTGEDTGVIVDADNTVIEAYQIVVPAGADALLDGEDLQTDLSSSESGYYDIYTVSLDAGTHEIEVSMPSCKSKTYTFTTDEYASVYTAGVTFSDGAYSSDIKLDADSKFALRIKAQSDFEDIYDAIEKGSKFASVSDSFADSEQKTCAALYKAAKSKIKKSRFSVKRSNVTVSVAGVSLPVIECKITYKYKITYKQNGKKKHKSGTANYWVAYIYDGSEYKIARFEFDNPFGAADSTSPADRVTVSEDSASANSADSYLAKVLDSYKGVRTISTPDITTVKAGKRSVTVKWKKVSSADKYEILYSTRKDMKNAKKKTVQSAKQTKTTIKNLKSGKKYYIQVRAIRDGDVYSKSAKKEIKVK